MKAKALLILVLCLLPGITSFPAYAGKNTNGKWVLHYAGPHDAKDHTCGFTLVNCNIQVNAPAGPGIFDVYILAVDVQGIAGTRFGLYGQGHFYFYGWTKCSALEIESDDWPGCGQGNAITWYEEQPGPHVTMGILHVYAYGIGRLWTGPDPRVGYAEWCDGSRISPVCDRNSYNWGFSIVGFGMGGCNPCAIGWYGCSTPGFDLGVYGSCDTVPISGSSWGTVKALYR